MPIIRSSESIEANKILDDWWKSKSNEEIEPIHREYKPTKIVYLYSDKVWRKKRKRILLERGEICERCGNDGNILHHIKPINLGGSNLDKNIKVVCRQCHPIEHAELRKGGIG
jgi:hypothetical protein